MAITKRFEVLRNKTILITGGTGSFGRKFLELALENSVPHRLVIYSRDEYKQSLMKAEYEKRFDLSRVRFFIGDVRDRDRLYRALDHVDYVIHAAAMKQVPTCEYNPFEAIKTNIHGAQNVIDAAIDRRVKKVVALSTDKAVNPINLYGGTKLVSDKLFVSANAYSKISETRFSVVRYGNVAGSRGSIIPVFRNLISKGETELPITDIRMTRFWITLEEGVDLVLRALEKSQGGETYISKIPSFRIIDLAEAMLPGVKLREIGIREGEKLDEIMITRDDCPYTYEFDDHYIVFPHFDWWNNIPDLMKNGIMVDDDFEYRSGTNEKWLSVDNLKAEVIRIEEESRLEN